MLVITILVGCWAITTGSATIATAIRLRRKVAGEPMYLLLGVFSIVFRLIVLVSLVRGAIAWLIGVYAVVYGCSWR